MATWIAAGAALIGLGIASRKLKVQLPKISKQVETMIGAQNRYKGGFQSEIDKYEAGKILGKMFDLHTYYSYILCQCVFPPSIFNPYFNVSPHFRGAYNPLMKHLRDRGNPMPIFSSIFVKWAWALA